jgi:hypothetical protein
MSAGERTRTFDPIQATKIRRLGSGSGIGREVLLFR